MTATPEPDVYQTATTINGLSTVTFVSRPYKRVVRSVFVNSQIAGAGCSIYRAVVGSTGGFIAGILNAFPNTYNVPFDLPPGQALYVVFTVPSSPVNAAFARISTFRDL